MTEAVDPSETTVYTSVYTALLPKILVSLVFNLHDVLRPKHVIGLVTYTSDTPQSAATFIRYDKSYIILYYRFT
jgi:hypothetical protein